MPEAADQRAAPAAQGVDETAATNDTEIEGIDNRTEYTLSPRTVSGNRTTSARID